MAMFKEMGWTVSCNPVSGRLCIYRDDAPGWIDIPIVEGAYVASVVNEDGDLVSGTTVQHKDLLVDYR